MKFYALPAVSLLVMTLASCPAVYRWHGHPRLFAPGRASAVYSDTVGIDETVVVKGLDVPWDMTWGPDNWIWFTEQKGLVRRANPHTGEVRTILRIPDVRMQRAVGLLGIAIHPDFTRHPYVFVDYSYLQGASLQLKVVRYKYEDERLQNPVVLLDKIPATETHNGSRIVFDAKGKLLITTGDIDRGRLSQDVSSPNGKILRINIDGTIPDDNPLRGNPVWSWGHRNPQGLVFASNGYVYSAEHGDVTDDEVNIITKGRNYGWPRVQGFCDKENELSLCNDSTVAEPLKTWTPTIAPSGIDYYSSGAIPQWKNSILVTTLKSASLRILKLNAKGDAVVRELILLPGKYGRLRDVCVSPSGDIYVSTSNRDWNKTAGPGFPTAHDDRIIRLSPGAVASPSAVPSRTTGKARPGIERGATIYAQYCESCHKVDGKGLPGVFPSLRGSAYLGGDAKDFVLVLFNGLDRAQFLQSMPSFDFLSDEEIADVANYVVKTFGSKRGETIRSSDVKQVRAEQ